MTKLLLSALVVLMITQLALATPDLCPDPSTAKNLVYTEEVHVDAPLFGRAEQIINVLSEKSPSCIIISGHENSTPNNYITVAGISFNDDGFDVRLISGIKKGINGEIQVYTA